MAIEIEWDLDDTTYPNFIIEDESLTEDDYVYALGEWFKRIAEYATSEHSEGDWNVIIADLWLDGGRVIGHVQKDDVAIGYDTGFRVCASFDSVYELWEEGAGEDMLAAEHPVNQTITGYLVKAVQLPAVKKALGDLKAKNDFYISVTRFGAGSPGDGTIIKF